MIKLERKKRLETVERALARYPAVPLVGPRQSGKTTPAHDIYKTRGGVYIDLEDPECPLRPGIAKQVLKDLQWLVVIDEFQRQPELLPLLRVLADRIEALPLRDCIQVALSELSI